MPPAYAERPVPVDRDARDQRDASCDSSIAVPSARTVASEPGTAPADAARRRPVFRHAPGQIRDRDCAGRTLLCTPPRLGEEDNQGACIGLRQNPRSVLVPPHNRHGGRDAPASPPRSRSPRSAADSRAVRGRAGPQASSHHPAPAERPRVPPRHPGAPTRRSGSWLRSARRTRIRDRRYPRLHGPSLRTPPPPPPPPEGSPRSARNRRDRQRPQVPVRPKHRRSSAWRRRYPPSCSRAP